MERQRSKAQKSFAENNTRNIHIKNEKPCSATMLRTYGKIFINHE